MVPSPFLANLQRALFFAESAFLLQGKGEILRGGDWEGRTLNLPGTAT